jgi:hypothetical protein
MNLSYRESKSCCGLEEVSRTRKQQPALDWRIQQYVRTILSAIAILSTTRESKYKTSDATAAQLVDWHGLQVEGAQSFGFDEQASAGEESAERTT